MIIKILKYAISHSIMIHSKNVEHELGMPTHLTPLETGKKCNKSNRIINVDAKK